MTTAQAPLSDLLVTVKSREIQRGVLAEMSGNAGAVGRHFLAAAHLELVLANDYVDAGQDDLAIRSRLSAASCFWRAGQTERTRAILAEIASEGAEHAAASGQVLAELESATPP
jgi:hypothetical protein